jgi:hypothetical protein
MVAIAGDRLRNNKPSLGPIETYALKRKKSPMANPTMP